jgi:hypothetical protein
LQKIEKKGREKRRDVTQTKEECLGDLLGVVCSLYLQNVSLSCKNSKQKLAGNDAKNTKFYNRNFCVYTENFQQRDMI